MLDSDKVKNQISQILRVPAEKVHDQAMLQDLVVDSFILIDMVIELQNTFKVRLNQEDLIPVKTVGDLVRVLNEKS